METIGNRKEFVRCINFDNWLIMKNHYPKGYGWIHADGTVGANAITQKWPTLKEFVEEWFYKLKAFPYLDLVIGITNWDETPGMKMTPLKKRSRWGFMYMISALSS